MKKFTLSCISIILFSCVAPPESSHNTPIRDSLPVNELYIVNNLAETLSILNLDRFFTANTPHTAHNLLLTDRVPNRLKIRGDYGYIVNSFGNSITIINRRTMQIIETVALNNGSNPWDIAFINKGGFLYGLVTNFLSDEVAIIRFNATGTSGTLLRSITLDPFSSIGEHRPRPEGICVVNNKAYIACTGWNFSKNSYDSGSVAVLDLTPSDPNTWSVASYVSVSTNPQEIIPLPLRNEAHIICTGINSQDDGKIEVLNTISDTITAQITIGGSPGRYAINTNNSHIYLSGTSSLLSYNYTTYAITHSNSNPLYKETSPSAFLSSIVYLPTHNKLLVTDFSKDRILSINPASGTLEAILPTGDGPIDAIFAKLP